MRRDQEIERLVKYAQALGVKVSFSNRKKPDNSAEWTLDGTEIIIYTKKQFSKTDTILSLVHEIGHSLDHIHGHDRVLDTEMEEAIDSSDEGETSKRQRKKILDSEIKGTQYWHTIYKETNLQIPLWKLYAAMEYDIWQYKVYHETGSFPKYIDKIKKRQAIYAKHKELDYE